MARRHLPSHRKASIEDYLSGLAFHHAKTQVAVRFAQPIIRVKTLRRKLRSASVRETVPVLRSLRSALGLRHSQAQMLDLGLICTTRRQGYEQLQEGEDDHHQGQPASTYLTASCSDALQQSEMASWSLPLWPRSPELAVADA